MKKILIFLFALVIFGCGGNSNQLDKIQNTLDSIQATNKNLKSRLDSISGTSSKSNSKANSSSTSNTTTDNISNTISDYDGNIYTIVTIGSQVWMAQNLKTTHYNDGTAIPNVNDNSTWASIKTGAYCNYDNKPAYSSIYGRLYNGYAVFSNHKLAPIGWHIPTDIEWSTLISYLGGETSAAEKLKEAGFSHWISPNTNASNSFGFIALPGGKRDWCRGPFSDLGEYGLWWSSTEYGSNNAFARGRTIGTYSYITRDGFDKNDGASVRCIKD